MPLASVFMRFSQGAFNRLRSRQAWKAVAADGPGDLRNFGGAKHCLVITYKRDGEAIPTPVWFGLAGGKLYFRSLVDNGKTKRIRNNGRVLVAPCSSRGRPTAPPVRATARVMAATEEAHAEATIAANYGLARRAYNALAAGKVPGVYVEVTPVVE